MLKENFKVYNEKYKFITDFQYEDNDNFFTEITKEIEQTAIRASMIMEPYRFEMLKMISEINCNTNNFQLYFNFSKFEKLCQLKPFQNRNSNSNSNKNDNEKYYTVDNKNSSDNQGEFNSICKEMEKLFDDNHSLTNSQCLNQNVSNENDNYNDNDNDNQNNNNISDVSQPELNNVEFSQQFIREMENDQNNDGFWNNEMVMQMSVFKRTLRKLKLKSKQSPSCNTYTNVIFFFKFIFADLNHQSCTNFIFN